MVLFENYQKNICFRFPRKLLPFFQNRLIKYGNIGDLKKNSFKANISKILLRYHELPIFFESLHRDLYSRFFSEFLDNIFKSSSFQYSSLSKFRTFLDHLWKFPTDFLENSKIFLRDHYRSRNFKSYSGIFCALSDNFSKSSIS